LVAVFQEDVHAMGASWCKLSSSPKRTGMLFPWRLDK